MKPQTWPEWFRDSADKFILLLIYAGVCLMVVHITHDDKDKELILWGREMAGTVLGSLLTLITSHVLAAKATSTNSAGKTETEVK
jgi:hypothetical protein